MQAESKPVTSAVRLAQQGYFWVGVTYQESEGQTLVDGTQLFVDFQVPEEQTQAYPVVLIHGGGGQGLDWMSTPDGRPGWRTLLLQRGFSVYTLDRPGQGRSPVRPAITGPSPMPSSVETLGVMFAGANNPEHTQWPGTGLADDPALAQLLASQGPMPDLAHDHELMRRRGAELLDRIGPAIIITNSAGGPAGWLMADERPDLVRAIVALEPLGPSGPFPLPWGLAACRMNYDPAPLAAAIDLINVQATDSEPPMRLQAAPPRRLPGLTDTPIAIVTGEQSLAGPMDAGTVAFLRQAGCENVDHLQLGDLGIHGNGHLMMLERNNDQVLDAVIAWVSEHVVLTP
ncbi:alpha-beta hydrolase superfamily lysophospholipase [Streptomyces brevispora]|uniref:Alpha-beta hydrolase superfamily lysophospholipase n=1 Tax=Streptomyces brevispora TaxID=887462 RepID=A0A561TYP8_9ACTN|nr:alpha-beta hydrolase superfamily lysophospholipase [Streptomyces brevispora]